jgi:ABC-2 type transport system permease protein
MKLGRVLTLLGKEFSAGTRNFIFVFAIVVPVVFTLVVSLLFGTLFLGTPKLGLVDQGSSALVEEAEALRGVAVRKYNTEKELKDAVAAGVVEVGMLLPAGFDQAILTDQAAELTIYVFGESLLRNRAILATSIASLVRDLSADRAPVTVTTRLVGDSENVPWEQRLLPFLVLMTIMIGGVMIPATSLVEEKQKRTLRALTVSPATVTEILTAKGLLGVIVSVVMSLVILALNRGVDERVLLLVVALTLGATLAAGIGVLLGAFVGDINTLFATIKGLGIVLYAPALVYLFPAIPEWVGRLFPTYYAIQPVVEIVQQGAGWAEVAPELAVMIGLITLLVVGIGIVFRRVDQFEE